ncbi:MAG: lipoprotein [Ilumatobacteraceae bacterium]|nr:lipoprotein [Ilumatobacteraceae bacterium]
MSENASMQVVRVGRVRCGLAAGALVVTAGFALGACGSSDSGSGATTTATAAEATTTSTPEAVTTLPDATPAPLTETAWTLAGTVVGDTVNPLPAGAEPPTLAIDGDANAQVFAGCNRGSSTLTVAGTALTFSPMALTRMACPGAAGELEHQVLAVLDGETTYTVDGDTLTITNGDQGLVYKAS